MPASGRAGVWPFPFPGLLGRTGTVAHAPITLATRTEIDWILRRLQQANVGQRLHAAGISLGGNALLKWAGERAEAAADVVTGVVGICALLDLAACATIWPAVSTASTPGTSWTP